MHMNTVEGENLRRRLNCDHIIYVEAVGVSGGIIVLRNDRHTSVEVISENDKFYFIFLG